MGRGLTRREASRVVLLLGGIIQGAALVDPVLAMAAGARKVARRGGNNMELPRRCLDGEMPVERAVMQRRTVRSFSEQAVSMEELSQLLWAGQGITGEKGFKRAAPSAGALYPADIYAVVGKKGVKGLQEGVYHYQPKGHKLGKTAEGDRRKAIAEASLWQMWMAEAPLCLVLTVEYKRITVKYGDRGVRYAHIEVGHIGQNVFLQCQALGLDAGIVGAFKDREVAETAALKRNHEPLIIMPVGRKG